MCRFFNQFLKMFKDFCMYYMYVKILAAETYDQQSLMPLKGIKKSVVF